MTTWYCDRCGERIDKSESRCSRCNKILYWQHDGRLFGSWFPRGITLMTIYEARELTNKWYETVKQRHKKKGLLSYWGYLLFGEGSNVTT